VIEEHSVILTMKSKNFIILLSVNRHN